MEVSGTGCRRRAIPRVGLCAVGAALWRPRRDPARAKPLRRSYAIILAPSLMKLKPTRDERADIPALGKKLTVDTALTWGAWVQWISFPRMDFFATMDSLLGPSGFGKRANRDAGEGRRPVASLHNGRLVECGKQGDQGEACDAPAVDRGSDDNRDNQSCCIAGRRRRTSGGTMHLSSSFNARLEAGGSAMGLHLPERSRLQF
jgi:hypothetical protein